MTDHEDIDVSQVRVRTLEQVVGRGHEWPRMAQRYGVANPVPPWKGNLDGMCDGFDRDAAVLPLAERRGDEDRLSETLYADLPHPERQLVALAHSLVARGVIEEDALARRMDAVRARLQST